jgi:endonuclease/exonuclease/phosphatase family metal-dependent hydrolase
VERIMTYNIHGGVGTDRRYDPARIARVIRDVAPSILGLQEVRRYPGGDQGVLEVIGKELPDCQVLFQETLSDERGSYGNALVTRHRILDHRDVTLVDEAASRPGGRQAEARRAIFAHLDVGVAPLWVIVTHLAVERWARLTQAVHLLRGIDEYTDHRREPVILMGDLNEWRRPNALLRHLDRSFSKHVRRRTFPSRYPIIPLDRIWLSRQLTAERVWAHRSHASRIASDHLPLCLECRLRHDLEGVDRH